MNHRAFICTGLIFVLGLALCKAHAQGPEGYTYLGKEGETVTLSERSNVAYGANGSFNYKYAIIGTITLSNSVFGDPAPGVAKSGYYKPVSDQPAANLIAYWPFDERGGDIAYDRMGDNHGQITGCTWVMPGKIGDAAFPEPLFILIQVLGYCHCGRFPKSH